MLKSTKVQMSGQGIIYVGTKSDLLDTVGVCFLAEMIAFRCNFSRKGDQCIL